MQEKVAKVSKKIRDKKTELWEKRVKLARKIRAFNFKITQRIRKAWRGFKRRIKDKKIPLLLKRFFIGFGCGIKYGVRDAINSWKYDRGKIDDYNIEIESLPFHGR